MFRKILSGFAAKIHTIPKKVWLAGSVAFVVLAYGLMFLWPKSVEFSYAEATCRTRLTLFPNQHKNTPAVFSVTYKNYLKIGNATIAATRVCFTPTTAPKEGTAAVSTSPYGWWFFQTNYRVHVTAAPRVHGSTTKAPIAVTKPVAFTIDQPDIVFDYTINANKKSQGCNINNATLSCKIDQLGLVQGSDNSLELRRNFEGKNTTTVTKTKVSILPAVTVLDTSIKNDQTVYEKPRGMTFMVDKALKSANVELEQVEGTSLSPITVTTTVKDAIVEVQFPEELTREKTYRVTLSSVEAADGSTINEPYVVTFKTSGGPKIQSVNVGTSGIDSNARIIVTFDQTLANSVNIAQYASIQGASAVVSKQGAQVIFSLQNTPRCAAITLNIAKGITSEQNGLVSTSDWSYNTRVTCRATSVIGYSVKGRPITAYYYGSGSKTILFTGGMHGSEPSGYNTMQAWVAHLDTNAPNIPAGTQIVIVPNTNPDGIAAGSRYNANGVNIDRNFPTADWKADIQVTGGGVKAGGGGSAALSEPETRAIADLTSQLRPRAEISFHAQGRLVGANIFGDSVNIGNIYASTVGYATMYENTEEIMGYELTGEYEIWMGEQLGVPAILIELPSAGGNYFASQQAALWKMVNL